MVNATPNPSLKRTVTGKPAPVAQLKRSALVVLGQYEKQISL
jgi:hypothetical protein